MLRLPRKSHSTTISSVKTTWLLSQLAKVLLCSIIIIGVLALADTKKGYQITPLSGVSQRYQISVEINRERAATYYRQMEVNGLDTLAARDVRLPNGILTVATVSKNELIEFLQSDEETATFSRVWSEDEHIGHKYPEDNRYTIYLPVKYATLVEGIKTAEAEGTSKYLLWQGINLPSGQHGACFLTVDEMEDYRRRMHTQGASSILAAFHFSLDGKSPIHNVPLLDRIA